MTKLIYAYRGSIAHNLYLPPEEEMSTDDRDFIGVYINPIDHYFGLEKKDSFESFVGTDDIVMFELKKFVGLLCKANPNVLSLLWNDKSMFLELHPLGQLLIDNRQLFATKWAYGAFGGYAKSQLSKMVKGAYRGYMGEKRKVLVDKYGYDTKNASHLIRLLHMGIELLKTGSMTVFVTGDHRQQLLDIKQGKWNIEQVEREASRLFNEMTVAHHNSFLRSKPNKNKINELLVHILSTHFKTREVNGLYW